jgi:hypothetical protein
MVIEVDAVSGREPQGTTLNHLLGSLRQVLDKPGGIGPRPTETFPGTKPKYTVEDLVALESAHRQTHTSGGEASLYILFLNGSFEREEVIGASYSASAYAIFVDTIRSVAEGNPFMSAADVERAVVLHEAGHLLRLVNIGYRSPRDHEDPDHEHHSSNPQSVMFHAVESSLIGSVFSGPPPDTFDADDKADLADLRSGRIKPT